MKIAFTSKGNSWSSEMDPRFGRAEYIFVYDEESEKIEVVENEGISQVEHGAGPRTAKLVFDINPDIIITGNGPGGNALRVLEKADIKMFTGASEMSLEEAYKKYQNNELTIFE